MKKSKPGSDRIGSRRDFVRKVGIGAVSLAGLQTMLSGCSREGSAASSSTLTKEALEKFFKSGDVVLFQGDSITDARRNKKDQLPNNSYSFGPGYAFLIAALLLDKLAESKLTIYNRGISGNKVFQLAERWQEDCLDLEPDVLSILIGVNDYWHMRNGRYEGTTEIYERDYRKLLERTRSALPDIRLVICQPFILPGTSVVDETWLEPFWPYQEIAAKIAEEFDAVWVPFQSVFDEATEIAPATYWTRDGVHPTMAGSERMADAWLKAVTS